ncbi:hypothetical protein D3C84_792990 [compost metagenome]
MAVAQYRDIIEHVQVRAALHVDQVVTPAALDTRRVDVVVLLRTGKARIATGQQQLGIDLRLGITSQPQQHRRRRAKRLPGQCPGRYAEQRWIHLGAPTQLDPQRPRHFAQHLPLDQCRAGMQRRRHAPQPHAQLRAIQLQQAVGRLVHDPCERGFERCPLRNAQLHVQWISIGLDGAVRSGAG